MFSNVSKVSKGDRISKASRSADGSALSQRHSKGHDNVDVLPASLTPEERRKRIESAAQITVEKYGPIIERLSKE